MCNYLRILTPYYDKYLQCFQLDSCLIQLLSSCRKCHAFHSSIGKNQQLFIIINRVCPVFLYSFHSVALVKQD